MKQTPKVASSGLAGLRATYDVSKDEKECHASLYIPRIYIKNIFLLKLGI